MSALFVIRCDRCGVEVRDEELQRESGRVLVIGDGLRIAIDRRRNMTCKEVRKYDRIMLCGKCNKALLRETKTWLRNGQPQKKKESGKR